MESNPNADSMTLVEASQIEEARRSVFHLILMMGAILLMILPFVTTFNEFLTRVAETLGLQTILVDWVVPTEVRMIAKMLGLVGIPSSVTSSAIILQKGGLPLAVYISWNCVGWQSFILYTATLLTGLQGPFTRISKIECMVVGFLGTFWMNLLRMASVAVVAFFFGRLPAVIYHDYGGTVIILLWLFAYWWFSHGWLLEPLEVLPEEGIEERMLQEIYQADEDSKKRQSLWRRMQWWKK